MTTKNQTIVQHNPLTSVQYKFEVSSIPHVVFHCQVASVPSVSIDSPMIQSSKRDFSVPGTKLEFDPLNIEFIVDKDLLNYTEIYNWMYRMVTVEPVMQEVSDGVLHILNADLTVNQSIKFIGLFPIMLGDLSFLSTSPSSDPIICSTTFNYRYFELPGFRIG
jgi:hypothetical protein